MSFKRQLYQIAMRTVHLFEIIPAPDIYEATQNEVSCCQVSDASSRPYKGEAREGKLRKEAQLYLELIHAIRPITQAEMEFGTYALNPHHSKQTILTFANVKHYKHG